MDSIEAVPAVITLIFTVLSPLITAWFTKVSMTPRVKNLIAVGISLVIAVGYVALSGGFTGVEDIMVPLGVVYGLQQVVYNQFLRGPAAKVEADHGVTESYKPKHLAE